MHIVSLNTGRVREIKQNGKVITTGIYKESVSEALQVHELGIEGDQQANLKVHGGVDKAVYAYPVEHYDYWKELLGRDTLPYGMFGENLSCAGYLENSVYFGDIFEAGTAELQVTMPRQPCSKLNLKFGDNQMARKFLASGRSGFYLRVLKPGMIKAGDSFTRISTSPYQLSINEFNLVFSKEKNNIDLLKKVIEARDVPLKYREQFGKHLDGLLKV